MESLGTGAERGKALFIFQRVKGSFYLFTLLPFYLSKAFYLSKTFLILSRASFIFSSLAQRLIRM